MIIPLKTPCIIRTWLKLELPGFHPELPYEILVLGYRHFLSRSITSENTNIYSIEVSMHGYKSKKNYNHIIPYTEENCE